ncbi:MAG: type II toxin-antitoxin system HicA family toxin [bacterium]|nr:type II toxin-antitoxin system HicA family toxin [bacterium]
MLHVLLKAGFRIIRQSGSHIRLRHVKDPHRQTTIPYHTEDIPRWLLGEILKQTKISVKELLKFLKNI